MTEKELHAEALRYHSQNGAGKLEICPTKPVNTPEDLSLAYSPGVAAPSLAIAADPELYPPRQSRRRHIQRLRRAGPRKYRRVGGQARYGGQMCVVQNYGGDRRFRYRD